MKERTEKSGRSPLNTAQSYKKVITGKASPPNTAGLRIPHSAKETPRPGTPMIKKNKTKKQRKCYTSFKAELELY